MAKEFFTPTLIAMLVLPKRRLVATACLCLLLCLTLSCRNEEVPAGSEKLFTLTVAKIVDKPDLFHQTPGQNTYYVVVGDASGKTIAYKELQPNTVFDFAQPRGFSGSELTISFLYRSPKTGYLLKTYRNVPVGASWKANDLDEDSVGTIPPAYQASFTVTNVPSGIAYLTASSGYSRNPEVNSGVTYKLNLPRPAGNQVWLQIGFTDNRPNRFFLLRNAEAGKTYEVDLATFEPGNAESMRLKESNSLIWTWVKGRQQNQWHTLFDSYGPNYGPVVPAFSFYYPNTTFTDFQLYAYLRKELPQSTLYNDEQQHVEGIFTSLPETLPTLDADFTVQSNAPGSFSMSTTGVFDYYTVQGYMQGEPGSTSLLWAVTGKAEPNIEFSFPQLPTEIFPKPSFEVKLTNALIEERSDIQSYEEYLEKVPFAQNPAPVTGNYQITSRQRNLR